MTCSTHLQRKWAILRAALLEGAGLADLWLQVAALPLFGVTISIVSSARFRTRLA